MNYSYAKLNWNCTAPTGAIASSNAHFGEGAGPVFLDNVLCFGTESRVVDCAHDGIGNANCDHREDAGVICQSKPSHVLMLIFTFATVICPT